ncbi:MAG: 3'-5' exonuclease [Lachnospiraceae bacterium]|nr:3'-5' exonuclease [Lachnospiraceae bacterium]
MVHIFVDYEMNEIDKAYKKERSICKREIIEIGAVKLDEAGREIDSFTQYVKPQFGQITEYYTNLTGITNEQVAECPCFLEAMRLFYEWAGKEDYTIYSWSDSDPAQISKEAALKEETDERLNAMLESWVDYQKEFGRLLGIEKKVGLKDAVHAIGEDFEGRQHDALWDARNTADIYRLSLDREKFNRVMSPIVELFHSQKQMGTTLGELFGSEFSNLFV